MPPALEKAWHTHGYYGSVSHNVKAVYQRYMGWFDGNPGRLWQHPPEAIGPRYVDAMGGVDRVVEFARQAFDDGDFRWAATLLDHAIFTDQNHAGARETVRRHAGADWRTVPRTRSGATSSCRVPPNCATATSAPRRQTASPSMLAQLTPEQMFDTLAISVNGPRAWDRERGDRRHVPDTAANYRLTLRNGVLVYRKVPAGRNRPPKPPSDSRTSCGC